MNVSVKETRITDVSLWIDGACSGNPGPGGYAYLIIVQTKNGVVERVDGAPSRQTTSNQMEVIALEQGLLPLKYGCNVTVHTDSANLIGWMSKGWKRKDPTLKLFLDRIDEMCADRGHKLTFVKVAGHSGVVNNERVDKEAQRQRDVAKTLF